MVKFNDIKSIDIDEKTEGIQSITRDSIVTIEDRCCSGVSEVDL